MGGPRVPRELTQQAIEKIHQSYLENPEQVLAAKNVAALDDNFTPWNTRIALLALIAEGRLVAWRKTPGDRLFRRLPDLRSGVTYYMTPARLESLQQEQLTSDEQEQREKPYREKAERNILARYADEVEAEFQRLWAEGL